MTNQANILNRAVIELYYVLPSNKYFDNFTGRNFKVESIRPLARFGITIDQQLEWDSNPLVINGDSNTAKSFDRDGISKE